MDTYLASSNVNTLMAYCNYFRNVIGPIKGREAIPAFEIDGEQYPEQPAVGDPTKWYACVRTPVCPEEAEGIEIVDPSIGIVLCGVWA